MMEEESAEERLTEFLYACPVGLVACDAAGEIALANPHAMQHLLPLCGDRDPGNLFVALEQHAPELRTLIASFPRASGRICDGHRIAVDLASGTGVPKVLACTVVKIAPDRLMVTLSDIGAQVAQERRLQQADAWFTTLLDRINDHAVVTLTGGGILQAADAGFGRLTGRAAADAIGTALSDLDGTSAGAGGTVREQLRLAARDGWHLVEGWMERADGSRFWCQRLGVSRQDGGFVMVLRDVPRRGVAADELRRLLTCDPLTGAANRRRFGDMLELGRDDWARTGRRLALVTFDLDHFKSINDRFGHPAGDTVLCRTVEACAALLPEAGLLARLGGEEFGALLPGMDETGALALAEEMRAAIADVALADGALRPTASFGCAVLDEVGGSADALVSLADQRLYAAKRDGRNRVHRPLPIAA